MLHNFEITKIDLFLYYILTPTDQKLHESNTNYTNLSKFISFYNLGENYINPDIPTLSFINSLKRWTNNTSIKCEILGCRDKINVTWIKLNTIRLTPFDRENKWGKEKKKWSSSGMDLLEIYATINSSVVVETFASKLNLNVWNSLFLFFFFFKIKWIGIEGKCTFIGAPLPIFIQLLMLHGSCALCFQYNISSPLSLNIKSIFGLGRFDWSRYSFGIKI